MCPVVVVVADILVHQTLEVPFIERNNVIEQVPAAATDEALGDSVLPWTAETGLFGLNAEAPDAADHLSAEIRGPVEDQVSRGRVVRKCLPQLLRYPRARWMSGHIAVQDASSVMGDYKKAVECAEGERRYGKEVHCGNGLAMIGPERCPLLNGFWSSWCLSHPAENRPLRDIETKHLQFAMNPWRSPGWILRYHAEDEFTQFLAHASSTNCNAMPRNPLPVHLKSGAVPANDRLGLHENQGLLPAWPKAAQENPKEPVRSLEPRLWMPLLQNGK